MLSRFRRPDADLRVQISQTELQAGEELEARVELVPKSNFHVREGRLELVCTEVYVQKTSSQYGAHYQRKSDTRVRVGETFTENGNLRSGVKYTTNLKLAVPADAPRSIRGTKVRNIEPGIVWEVEAYLDVASARDLRESIEVKVVEPSTTKGGSTRPVTAEVEHRQGRLNLELPSESARSGDTLDGRLLVEMAQDVSAEEIRVELVREEKFGNDAKEHTVDQVTLESDASLELGDAKEWRFQLNIGQVEVPTLKTEKSYVRWFVKAVLARAMRTDLRVEQDISVDY